MITKCPKCRGNGYTRDSVTTNPFFIVCTLGLSLAMTDECTACEGRGIIESDNE